MRSRGLPRSAARRAEWAAAVRRSAAVFPCRISDPYRTMGFRMKLRSSPLLSVLFSLLLLASTLSPAVHAQDASGLDGIQAAYHDLLDLFYRPLDPTELLHVGWSSLSADADPRGAPKPAPLPDLPGDPDQ